MNISIPIYMDYSATTPVDERVAEKMCTYLTRQGQFGNRRQDATRSPQATLRVPHTLPVRRIIRELDFPAWPQGRSRVVRRRYSAVSSPYG